MINLMVLFSQSMDAMMDQDEVLPSTQQPIIQVEKMLQMKKKHGSQRPQQIFSQTEEELNPQLNQQLKKQLKAQQKKARRQTEPITNLNDEDGYSLPAS